MATRQNLIDTYNSNPTLQSKYTLPQYLALFNFSQTTTPTQTPTTTPTQTPATPGIPNIINQNINQGGGGGNGPPPGPTFNRNDLLGTSDYQGPAPGFFESIMGIPAAAFNAYQQFSPLGFLGRKIEANKIAKEKALQAKIDADNKAAAERAAFERAMQQGRGFYDQFGKGDAASSKSREEAGSGFSDASESGPFKDGGRVYLYNRLK